VSDRVRVPARVHQHSGGEPRHDHARGQECFGPGGRQGPTPGGRPHQHRRPVRCSPIPGGGTYAGDAAGYHHERSPHHPVPEQACLRLPRVPSCPPPMELWQLQSEEAPASRQQRKSTTAVARRLRRCRCWCWVLSVLVLQAVSGVAAVGQSVQPISQCTPDLSVQDASGGQSVQVISQGTPDIPVQTTPTFQTAQDLSISIQSVSSSQVVDWSQKGDWSQSINSGSRVSA